MTRLLAMIGALALASCTPQAPEPKALACSCPEPAPDRACDCEDAVLSEVGK